VQPFVCNQCNHENLLHNLQYKTYINGVYSQRMSNGSPQKTAYFEDIVNPPKKLGLNELGHLVIFYKIQFIFAK